MRRRKSWMWAIVATLAYVPASLADEIQLHRDWIGKISVSASVLGGPQRSAEAVVPSPLDPVLDDVADNYTVDSLDYADGGQDSVVAWSPDMPRIRPQVSVSLPGDRAGDLRLDWWHCRETVLQHCLPVNQPIWLRNINAEADRTTHL